MLQFAAAMQSGVDKSCAARTVFHKLLITDGKP